jgi:hypothetical protein
MQSFGFFGAQDPTTPLAPSRSAALLSGCQERSSARQMREIRTFSPRLLAKGKE